MVDQYDVDMFDLKTDLSIQPKECVSLHTTNFPGSSLISSSQALTSFQGSWMFDQGAYPAPGTEPWSYEAGGATEEESGVEGSFGVPSATQKEGGGWKAVRRRADDDRSADRTQKFTLIHTMIDAFTILAG
jgi:hypothetical protein